MHKSVVGCCGFTTKETNHGSEHDIFLFDVVYVENIDSVERCRDHVTWAWLFDICQQCAVTWEVTRRLLRACDPVSTFNDSGLHSYLCCDHVFIFPVMLYCLFHSFIFWATNFIVELRLWQLRLAGFLISFVQFVQIQPKVNQPN